MINLPNIEKSAFVIGGYTGYAGGKVWAIRRLDRRTWRAMTVGDVTGVREAPTLASLSKKLTAIDDAARAKMED